MKITEVTQNQRLNEFVFIPPVVVGLTNVILKIGAGAYALHLAWKIYTGLRSGEMTIAEAVKLVGEEAAYALGGMAAWKGAAMGFRAFKKHWKKATAGTVGIGAGTGVAAQTNDDEPKFGDEPIKENLAKGLRAIFNVNVVKNFDEYKKEVFSILRRSPKFKHLSDEKIEKMSHTITTAETSKRTAKSAAPDGFDLEKERQRDNFDNYEFLPPGHD